ncbi:GIY-YIG nuclease family protein [Psychrobacter sp.]|uniref:GIY-YIG nuclease family protein n=1 Tax=Psychrobacter sp. TaxID=56811 RepID=UPI003F969E78
MNPLIPSAKTIQIYLPKGNPRGLRLAEMTTRTVRLIEIPRIHINDFFAMPDANQVGLYFLIGDSVEKPLLYVGQTGDLKRRLNQHDDKDFWTRAFVMLSTNNSMTQTHALYMEHKAIATAIEVGRYELKNGNNGNKPHTPDPLKADCEELFHTLDVLLSTLGQPIFESLAIHDSLYSNETYKNKSIDSTIAKVAQIIDEVSYAEETVEVNLVN